MPKPLDQQRNGGRTDLPDDFKRLLMQVFIVTGEEAFFSTVKTELAIGSKAAGTRRWSCSTIEVFYNQRRRHSTIDYRGPTQFERRAARGKTRNSRGRLAAGAP